MDAKKVFKAFADDLSNFTDSKVSFDTDEVATEIETTYFPLFAKILQKDETFFHETRMLFGVNLSQYWNQNKEVIWKHLQLCLVAAFLHGDIKSKITKVMDFAKTFMQGKDDDISKILNDSESESRIKEILDFVMDTKLAKMFMKIVEQFDVSELNINLENPEEIIELLKNPDNPVIQKVISKIQGIIKSKMERGELTQHGLMTEIEAIKAKVTSMFGDAFNDFLGGKKGQSSSALLSSGPEARRQRMLARLQKKLREKNSR
jgi:hypothetical protein